MKKAMKMLMSILKPLMNERGAVGDPEPITVTLDENGFIPGTSFKSMDDFIKGHSELKGKFDAQGNELGSTRKQAETLANTLKDVLGKEKPAPKEPPVDYGKEVSRLQGELKKLDPMDEKYSERHAALISELLAVNTNSVKGEVLSTAGKLFQDELSKRDQNAAIQKFNEENPTFNTPETQERIKQYLANDRTGMHDKFSAYFQMQRDDESAKAKALVDENAEMKKVLDLQKGKDSTGKVITKGQAPQQTAKTQLKGKDLDAAMAEALAKAGGKP